MERKRRLLFLSCVLSMCIWLIKRKTPETKKFEIQANDISLEEYSDLRHLEESTNETHLLECARLNSIRNREMAFTEKYGHLTASLLTVNDTQFKVPNIVHYNWYANERKPLYFQHWISVISALKLLKPSMVIFHFNLEPVGPYWRSIKTLPTVTLSQEPIPDSILGHKIPHSDFFTHGSDLGRINAMIKTGGIYLDLDVLVVRSFDELRKYPCTIGFEAPGRACGGIIICSKDSPFLFLWANAFVDDFKPWEWAYNSGLKPAQLSQRFPSLVHIEMTKLHHPNYMEPEIFQLWTNATWNWRDNYAVHTWHRDGQKARQKYTPVIKEPSINNIWTMNNTYAEICRYILSL